MSDKSLFVRIFKGKDLEDRIDIEHGLLPKLVAFGVIESSHRIDIEVNCVTVAKFFRLNDFFSEIE